MTLKLVLTASAFVLCILGLCAAIIQGKVFAGAVLGFAVCVLGYGVRDAQHFATQKRGK